MHRPNGVVVGVTGGEKRLQGIAGRPESKVPARARTVETTGFLLPVVMGPGVKATYGPEAVTGSHHPVGPTPHAVARSMDEPTNRVVRLVPVFRYTIAQRRPKTPTLPEVTALRPEKRGPEAGQLVGTDKP